MSSSSPNAGSTAPTPNEASQLPIPLLAAGSAAAQTIIPAEADSANARMSIIYSEPAPIDMDASSSDGSKEDGVGKSSKNSSTTTLSALVSPVGFEGSLSARKWKDHATGDGAESVIGNLCQTFTESRTKVSVWFKKQQQKKFKGIEDEIREFCCKRSCGARVCCHHKGERGAALLDSAAGPYESDAMVVMRMMIALSAISLSVLILYIIVRVKEIFANMNPSQFFVQNYPTGVSILFVAWGLSYHLLSHLIRIHYDSPEGREGMAGTSGRDEYDSAQTSLRSALQALEPSSSSSSPPLEDSYFDKLSLKMQRYYIRLRHALRHEGNWFGTWADGEPDFADLAVEVRGEARAAGAGVKVLRLPMATTPSLAYRMSKAGKSEAWTIADAGGVCAAVPTVTLPRRDQDFGEVEVLKASDLDPALLKQLLG
ncbi:hypothetical protein HDU97_000248 [Phlyctochytrium planicorne]|nr:hypothetical protein HDU97_000248 [Phlyctochytrium planicorne]